MDTSSDGDPCNGSCGLLFSCRSIAGKAGDLAHDVFISYPSVDKATADSVAAALESHGLRCWYAPRDVVAGADWAGSIVQAIGASRLMVLVFSEAANASEHILREVRQAADARIAIVPFRISSEAPSTSLDYYIGGTHWLDALTRPLEDHLEQLVEAAQRILGKEPSGPAAVRRVPSGLPSVAEPTAPERSPSIWARVRGRPVLLLGIATVAVVLAVVGAAALMSDGGETAASPSVSSAASQTTISEDGTQTIASATDPITSTATTANGLTWLHNPATDHYYALTRSGLSWEELDALARENGGYLASIGDVTEEEWLYSRFGGTLFWIGLTDQAVEGQWRWTSGEQVTYLSWCPGEPTDIAGGAGTEDAVHTIPFMQCWNDDVVWATEFLADELGNMVPSFPGVIELDHEPD